MSPTESDRLRAVRPGEAMRQNKYPDGPSGNEGGYPAGFRHRPRLLTNGPLTNSIPETGHDGSATYCHRQFSPPGPLKLPRPLRAWPVV